MKNKKNLWDQGRSNAETYSDIGERQDDFIRKQKSANTNKKMATDLNTLLHSL